MAIRAAYCNVSDVKRLLSAQEQKVKFSASYRRLEWNINNSGTIRLTNFTIADSYQGQERFTMVFTDSTSFTFTGEEIGFQGNGNLNSSFTSNDGSFTIVPADWTGAAQVDDEIYFETTSNLSDDNAILFMRDAMYRTNGLLRETFGDSTNVSFYMDDSITLPHEIELGNIMLSACFIFQSVFVGANLEESPIQNWCDDAIKMMEDFIKALSSREGIPHWRTRPAHITTTGIAGVEQGKIEPTDYTDDEGYDR